MELLAISHSFTETSPAFNYYRIMQLNMVVTNMTRLTPALLLLSLLTACGGGSSSPTTEPESTDNNDQTGNNSQSGTEVSTPENMLVYQGSGKLQCEDESGTTHDQSSQTLTNAGIDVVATYCGELTGVAFLAVCGGETGEIFAHEIRATNLSDAIDLGYDDIETLVSEADGTGYDIGACE